MLKLARWTFSSAYPSPQSQRSLILDHAVPARDILAHARSYISRQGNDVWLSVIAEPTQLADSDAGLGGLLGPVHQARIESDSDALLALDARDYVDRLHRTTDLALELLGATDYRAHQQFLVLVMCAGNATVEVVRAYCQTHCSSSAAWSQEARNQFWSEFFTPGPRPELSFHGHWLWNIVVRPQPCPGDDPQSILENIGAV